MRLQLAPLIILAILQASLAQGVGGQDDPCIRAYGTASVEHFLADLQHSVAVDDRAHVAEMVRFPISITVEGKALTLRNKDQLLKYYNVAFDTKVKGFIAKQEVSKLFCNSQGVMIGRGEIWINTGGGKPSQLKTVAINNNPPWSTEDN
ncbi:MAG: hypothetical protein WBM24_00475 [Candidatus Sulfotelmatobacter sp.]